MDKVEMDAGLKEKISECISAYTTEKQKLQEIRDKLEVSCASSYCIGLVDLLIEASDDAQVVMSKLLDVADDPSYSGCIGVDVSSVLLWANSHVEWLDANMSNVYRLQDTDKDFDIKFVLANIDYIFNYLSCTDSSTGARVEDVFGVDGAYADHLSKTLNDVTRTTKSSGEMLQ